MKLLFCENRNQFFKGEQNGVTLWTKDRKEAKEFTTRQAEELKNDLSRSITDWKYIIIVETNFERYN